jgi:hypothetical protein
MRPSGDAGRGHLLPSSERVGDGTIRLEPWSQKSKADAAKRLGDYGVNGNGFEVIVRDSDCDAKAWTGTWEPA